MTHQPSAFTDEQWTQIHALDLPSLKFMLATQMHEITRLKGEAGVYVDLLRECVNVIRNVVPDNIEAATTLDDLTEAIDDILIERIRSAARRCDCEKCGGLVCGHQRNSHDNTN